MTAAALILSVLLSDDHCLLKLQALLRTTTAATTTTAAATTTAGSENTVDLSAESPLIALATTWLSSANSYD